MLGGGFCLHKLKDKEKYLYLLKEQGYNTPVKKLIGLANKIKS